MKIQLSGIVARQIEERVASGEFATPEDVISEAVALLSVRDKAYGEWLREAVAVGEADADAGRLVSLDSAYFDRLRQRILERTAGRND